MAHKQGVTVDTVAESGRKIKTFCLNFILSQETKVLIPVHRSGFGFYRLPSGNSSDAFATVLDGLLLPDDHFPQH